MSPSNKKNDWEQVMTAAYTDFEKGLLRYVAGLSRADMSAQTSQTKNAVAVKLTEATTLNGWAVTIDTTSGLKINNAKVLNADIECNNGVVHVIDTVLMPE